MKLLQHLQWETLRGYGPVPIGKTTQKTFFKLRKALFTLKNYYVLSFLRIKIMS